MDGVLEGAAVLCICKLACSLLFVPSLTTSHSRVSFCCCCLLIFTDFLVAVFLSVLCISGSWLTEPSPENDVVALRFLLFLSHTYGAVFLLTTPLIAAETLTRLLWPCSVVTYGADGQTVEDDDDDDGQRCCTAEVNTKEEEEGRDKNGDEGLSPAVCYLCCLSVWFGVALNVRWRWRLQEEWTAACLYTTNSLVRCLPNMFSPIPSNVSPFWGSAFVLLLLVLLTTSTSLQRMRAKEAHRTRRRLNRDGDTRQEGFSPTCTAPSERMNGGMPEAAQRVDPEKTESSCDVHRTRSWNIVQMLARHHGDFVFICQGCLSTEWGGQEPERTTRGIPPTSIEEGRKDSRGRSQLWWWWLRGFPCPWVNVMIGFVGVLCVFVLPMNLSVNILLFRMIETLLEQCITYLLASVANTGAASASHNGTFV